ncbi:hypothetical protein TNCV_5119501 [Trichonephila clavipes]|nr:hypothetical protein TNCV_5119501 [Trichonephila clavipes]
MTKSVVIVAAIVGYNRCHTPRHKIKEALDVSLGYSSSCGSRILPKLIWQRVVYPGPVVVQTWIKRFQLTIDQERKQAKEVIQSDWQKLDSSVNTISFHSVVHVRRSSHHRRRKSLCFPVKGKQSNERLAGHSTLLQTASNGMSGHGMLQKGLNLWCCCVVWVQTIIRCTFDRLPP